MIMQLNRQKQETTRDCTVETACQLVKQHMLFRNQGKAGATATTRQLRRALLQPLSKQGRDAVEVIESLHQAVQAGLMGNTGPDFYGWVMGASHQVGVAADLLTSAWGQNAAIYQTSPAAAIAEEAAEQWLLDLLDLPDQSSVAFTTGATMASFISLAAARSEVLHRKGWDVERQGLARAPDLSVFIGEEAHVSVLAVLRYLGIGTDQLIRIPVDDQGRLLINELQRAVEDNPGPSIIIGQAGHINSGAFDDFNAMAEIAENNHAWLHIDAAFGLWARCAPRRKHLTYGLERADSWAVDGHKWLQVPYDSGYAIVRDKEAHKRAMSAGASFLNRSTEDGRNPSDYGPELSRRARGFTTWAVLQHLGKEGVAEMVERHCQAASCAADRLRRVEGIEILNDVCLNQVVVSFHNENQDEHYNREATDKVIAALQHENRQFVSGCNWRGKRVLRISVISGETTRHHLDSLCRSIRSVWQQVRISMAESDHRTGVRLNASEQPDYRHVQTVASQGAEKIQHRVGLKHFAQQWCWVVYTVLFWSVIGTTTMVPAPV